MMVVCVCACAVEYSFIVINSGGWWSRVALYSLWSPASIIKEWYLLRRTGVIGAKESRGGCEGGVGKKLSSDGCLHRL